MQMPLQVTFRTMTQSDALATHFQRRTEELDHLFDRIVSCHVVVELVGHHHRHGDRHRVSINLGLPGHTLLVTHDPPDDHGVENAHTTANRAFDEVSRQLEDWLTRRRRDRHQGARESRLASEGHRS